MHGPVKIFLCLVLAITLQTSILPAFFEDPFKPNLMIILIAYLALRVDTPFLGAVVAYFLGLIQGVFSGIYFGLAGISLLLIYALLRKLADQLYTDSDHLMVVVVFFATLVDATVSMLLLLLFSAPSGIYASFLTNLLPQAVVNAFVASLLFGVWSLGHKRVRT